MQKLQQSFKILPEIPIFFSSRNVFLESKFCKNFVVSLTEKNPKQVFNSPLTQPHAFSHFCFSSSRSWRSHHSVSESFSGFLSNPVFFKQLVSSAHLKNGGRRVFDRGFLFLQNKFRTRHSESNPMFYLRRAWSSLFPTGESMVLGLISANAAVFMLWRILDPKFMRKNFMISVENFTSGRVYTLITCAFSHKDIGHLFSNMFGLYLFGRSIGQAFGPEFVLKLYLAGAVVGSIFFLVHQAYLSSSMKGTRRWYIDPSKTSGLGASGAVNSILLLHIFLFPKSTYLFYYIIPVPAALLGVFLIGSDLWMLKEKNGTISGSAHLGGAFVAALVWARIKKGWI